MADSDRMIPDERDQIELPKRPDLRCAEHGGYCELIHTLRDRVAALEEEVRAWRMRLAKKNRALTDYTHHAFEQ